MAIRYPEEIDKDLKKGLDSFHSILTKISEEKGFESLLNKDSLQSALAGYEGELSEIDGRIVENSYIVLEKASKNDLRSVDDIVEKTYYRICPAYTRFEKARIIGSRALQISYGAPVLIDLPDDVINSSCVIDARDMTDPICLLDPVNIAMVEYNKGIIPITVADSDLNKE